MQSIKLCGTLGNGPRENFLKELTLILLEHELRRFNVESTLVKSIFLVIPYFE